MYRNLPLKVLHNAVPTVPYGQLFDEPVAEDFEEAEEFLEDCMAVVLDSLKDVKKYLDGMGADVEGISLKELEEESEVFKLPDGKYMIVEG